MGRTKIDMNDQFLRGQGITNAKKWLIDNDIKIERAKYSAGQKPISAEYQGEEKFFYTYKEAAWYYYQEINKD